ncbi:MAG TPA: type II secretion system protein GspE, partial [Gammaproteobacteria bacterium]
MSYPPPTVAEPGVHEPPLSPLPFAFAKRHGVLLEAATGGTARLLHRPGVALGVLAEVRRYANRPLRLEALPTERFETLLARTYEDGTAQAGAIIGNVEEDLALADVVRELDEPEDLLEAQDDAPVIRLINALFAEAIRGGASD